MSRVTRVTATKLKLTEEDQQDLRLAALLHDVGHYPYSHLMERLDDVLLAEDQIATQSVVPVHDPYPDHERLGRIIVTEQKDLLDAIGGKKRASRIAGLFTKAPEADQQRSKLIHSSLDMDRLDYLTRDAHAAGVPYGHIDLPYLLNNLRASSTGMIGIEHKAITAAEQFLLARYFMHRTVYYHKTTFGLEEACRQLLRRCRDAGKFAVPKSGAAIESLVRNQSKLMEFTDHFVDFVARQAVEDSDAVISALGMAIVFRKPPKLLGEAASLVDTTDEGNMRHNAATSFLRHCRAQVSDLSRKSGVPLGKFLIAQVRPIRLEKRGPTILASEAPGQIEEKEDELIKVFVPGQDEPRSLVDVSESIVRVCANYASRVTRLYVVCDSDVKVANLRQRVAAWL